MNPTLLLIRHSNTAYDKKVDALLDPPLSVEGTKRIKRTIEFLHASSYKPQRLLSSPRQRALRAAEMFANGKIKLTTHNEALPWNLGDLQGKANKEVDPVIALLEEFPDLCAPHGESYRTFHNRWEEFLSRVMQYVEIKSEAPIFIFTHSRNINDTRAIIDSSPVGTVQDWTPEASVTLVSKDEGGEWHYELIWEGK